MKKPVFMLTANAVAGWDTNMPGAADARHQAFLRAEMAAMYKIVSISEPIAVEITEISVQITELEAKREFLAMLYRDLELQYKSRSNAYDKRLSEK